MLINESGREFIDINQGGAAMVGLEAPVKLKRITVLDRRVPVTSRVLADLTARSPLLVGSE